uniref:Uncharacterized protein n=1 Tax=Plectus sambesii TaxID=2011161 RepID=A0A914VQS4_9BILA
MENNHGAAAMRETLAVCEMHSVEDGICRCLFGTKRIQPTQVSREVRRCWADVDGVDPFACQRVGQRERESGGPSLLHRLKRASLSLLRRHPPTTLIYASYPVQLYFST